MECGYAGNEHMRMSMIVANICFYFSLQNNRSSCVGKQELTAGLIIYRKLSLLMCGLIFTYRT